MKVGCREGARQINGLAGRFCRGRAWPRGEARRGAGSWAAHSLLLGGGGGTRLMTEAKVRAVVASPWELLCHMA